MRRWEQDPRKRRGEDPGREPAGEGPGRHRDGRGDGGGWDEPGNTGSWGVGVRPEGCRSPPSAARWPCHAKCARGSGRGQRSPRAGPGCRLAPGRRPGPRAQVLAPRHRRAQPGGRRGSGPRRWRRRPSGSCSPRAPGARFVGSVIS